VVVGLVLLVILVVLIAGGGDTEGEKAATRFGKAWERGDYAAMYRELAPGSRDATPEDRFRAAHESARATATAAALRAGKPGEEGGRVRLPVQVDTRVFGTVRGDVELGVDEKGRLLWAANDSFPGVPEGAALTRRSEVPRRAAILSRSGRVMTEGQASARKQPLGATGGAIVGQVGAPKEPDEQERLYARGFERDSLVGLTGLERILDRKLAGTPGGRLMAGDRTLAAQRARAGEPVRTTIDLEVQDAAVRALGARFGGVAAIDPRTAEVRALAGIAFSAPQPPGSTFKIITTAAALEDDKVTLRDRFPVETKAVIDGTDLDNANEERCGGTFPQTFAHSCNSVFAPLGVKVGAKRLVEESESFGFNQDPGVPGAKPSTIPEASQITSDLDLGASAIGQGKVLATPLEMAIIAHTIANGGLRRRPAFEPDAVDQRPVRVTTAKVAKTIERLMVRVVADGTGTAARIPGVRVAGKTGTAELGPVREVEQDPGSDTDAWFTSYAPAGRSKLAVAVLLVRAGAGGQTAAPVARQVLQAGLD
jgi:cell division protein FtsI/penicillin-binding protein 2